MSFDGVFPLAITHSETSCALLIGGRLFRPDGIDVSPRTPEIHEIDFANILSETRSVSRSALYPITVEVFFDDRRRDDRTRLTFPPTQRTMRSAATFRVNHTIRYATREAGGRTFRRWWTDGLLQPVKLLRQIDWPIEGEGPRFQRFLLDSFEVGTVTP